MSFTISPDILFTTRMPKQEMAMELAVIMYHRGRLPLTPGGRVRRDGSRSVPAPALESRYLVEAGGRRWRALRFLMSSWHRPG